MYDREHVYVTWGGHLGDGGQEIWQNGVRVAPPVIGDSASFPTQAQGQALMNAMQTLWIAAGNQTGASTYLQWVKFSLMTKLGTVHAAPLVIPTTPTAGIKTTITTNPHPWQTAFCMTLRSGQNYGKGNYGRVYLPDPRFNVGTDGLIAGSPQSYANWFASWLKGIENSAATWTGGAAPMFVHIMNNSNSDQQPGVSRRVASIRAGNVLDTQRRRRNNLVETYVTATGYP